MRRTLARRPGLACRWLASAAANLLRRSSGWPSRRAPSLLTPARARAMTEMKRGSESHFHKSPTNHQPPTTEIMKKTSISMKKTSATITIAAFAILGCSTHSQAATLLTGGDAADGWILPSAGDVIFAVGMGNTGATLQGVTFTTSSPQLSGATGFFGVSLSYPSPSADDTALAAIGNRLHFSGGVTNLTMTLLNPGQTYQLDQLFTAGGFTERSMQVFIDSDGDGTVDATAIDTLNLSNPNNVFLVRTTAKADLNGTIRVQLTPFNNTGGGGFAGDGTVLSAVVLSIVPEPSAALLGGLGLLALLRRRR